MASEHINHDQVGRPLGERLSALEAEHKILSRVVEEDHRVIISLDKNFEVTTSLLKQMVETDAKREERQAEEDERRAKADKSRDEDIANLKEKSVRGGWERSIFIKILVGLGALFLSINSGGGLIQKYWSHLFGG